jgi:hypothetical protein
VADGNKASVVIAVAVIGAVGVIISAVIARGANESPPATSAAGSPTKAVVGAASSSGPLPGASSSSDLQVVKLDAPTQLLPKDNSTFSTYPRKLQVIWNPVPGAASYSVEVDFECADNVWCPLQSVGGSGIASGLTGTTYTLEFVGAQPGRWRVWAVGNDGRHGLQSPWRVFTFTR